MIVVEKVQIWAQKAAQNEADWVPSATAVQLRLPICVSDGLLSSDPLAHPLVGEAA